MNDGELRELFGRVLPTQEQTLLLRCLLLEGSEAASAWARWLAQAGDADVLLRPGRRSVRGLNAALLSAVQRNALAVPPRTLSVLRLAALKEQMRSRAYRRVLADTLSALARANVPAIVGKGAALAETVYAQPSFRHCHDIDLLVAPGDLDRAARCVERAGFSATAVRPDRQGQSLARVHRDGLPLALHSGPMPWPVPPELIDQWWQGARRARLGGVDARIANPTLALLQVCALAFSTRGRSSLRWVTDSWHLIQAGDAVDWDALCAAAHGAQFSLGLWAMVDYLARELAAPVPAPARDDLRAAARHERLGSERALYAVWSTTRRNGASLKWMLGGRRLRPEVLRWAIAPSTEYMRAAASPGGWGGLALAYVLRPLRFATERIRHRQRRPVGSVPGPAPFGR